MLLDDLLIYRTVQLYESDPKHNKIFSYLKQNFGRSKVKS